ncbi:PQQ-dependent dehydrogenase, methanol/ethanol family [Aurantiacibacter xanthus]|uniref:PQQ-dependent dehydrogenase, methanol/ethanol family n=1 Tax=Aurantiacibacter xanthus TaxID=1784712 RepID=A0A3A1P5A2_9SPHN|nr:PQQ-dependent dehydrogenase, methanol/ethanol family [Aurantiacibacter xanthus]RIV85521.1 PQQ-dependent dehydrogenase, methanol/ethanol family [Aurantiacibacter xanthus]
MRGWFGAAIAAVALVGVTAAYSQGVQPSAQEWAAHGGSSNEQYYSQLTQIDASNVADLKPAWFFEYDTVRGQEGEAIVADGVLYISTAWSKVYALDAKTGAELWKYDPKVPGEAGPKGCCDVVNRGVAVSDGRVFITTFDGRMVALDAKTGSELWVADTIANHAMDYTSTGAPRVFKGKVIIGQGGAEKGVRGYVTAYDVATGAKAWRFYLTPPPPGVVDGEVSDRVLEEMARPTWFGDLWHTTGGGGAPWDSIVYDEELDQLLIGTGNGSPHSHYLRSAGQGDNLFLASVLALDPDTGEYRWHYQQTPGDSWDYTSVQNMILADLEIDGRPRKVILHAPKNGFFYVIDRESGQPISARPYAEDIRWATGIDTTFWRPIEVPGARYVDRPFLNSPHVGGAHNWQPMAFSPRTGLAYIPTVRNYFTYSATSGPHQGEVIDPSELPKSDAYLQAFDPLTGQERWRVDANGWKPDTGGGGVLVTASDLVFQGRGDILGEMLAIDARSGEVLWRYATPNAVMASPITYMIDGEQYIAVSTGGGGGGNPLLGSTNPPREKQPGRMVVFKLNGTATLPAPPPLAGPATDPDEVFPADKVALGAQVYGRNCIFCHGMNRQQSNIITDLRRSPVVANAQVWRAVVHDGAFLSRGMPKFDGKLSVEEVEAIRNYMGAESQALARDQRAGVAER